MIGGPWWRYADGAVTRLSVSPAGAVGRAALIGLASLSLAACSDGTEGLSPPSVPTATVLSARNVSLSWDASAWDGAESLSVDRRQGGSEPVVLRPAPQVERVLDHGLPPGQDTDYRLCREGPGAARACSDWVAVATPTSALGVTVDVTVPHDGGQDGDDLFLIGLVDLDNQASFGALLVFDRAGQLLWELVDTTRGYVNDAEMLDDGTLLFNQFAEVRSMSLFFEPISRFVHADHPLITVPDSLFDSVTTTTEQFYHHDEDLFGADAILSVVLTAGHDDVSGWDIVGDGVVVFDRHTGEDQWFTNLFDHYDVQTDSCLPCLEELTFGQAGHDWTHANALWFDAEQSQIYLNIRNLDRIAVFDYPSGDLVREIGDGGVTFAHAHDPQYLPDGTILLFDNGLHRPGGEEYSRAVQFKEGAGGQLEVVWEYRETPDFYSDVMGDADRLESGNTLITDAVNGRIVEVDPEGGKVWEARLSPPGMSLYKTQRIAGAAFRQWCGLEPL
jgi:hypothetical protein